MYIFGGRIPESKLTREDATHRDYKMYSAWRANRVIHKPCGTNAQWRSVQTGLDQPWVKQQKVSEDLFCIDDYDLVRNDIWRYDIMNNSWHEIKPAPESPIPLGRHGHGTVIWDDMIYLFGGYYDPVRYLDDTWHFNISVFGISH